MSIPFRTIAPVRDGSVIEPVYDVTAHNEALADLKFLKEKVDEFYAEAVAAFNEFPVG